MRECVECLYSVYSRFVLHNRFLIAQNARLRLQIIWIDVETYTGRHCEFYVQSSIGAEIVCSYFPSRMFAFFLY